MPDEPKEKRLESKCQYGLNCTAWESETYLCCHAPEQERRDSCGAYRSIEKYNINSKFYKIWRLGAQRK